MTAEILEHRRDVAPVFEKLARRLPEIDNGPGRAVKSGIECLGDKVVNAVAQLVEEDLHVHELEKRGLCSGGSGNAAH